MRTILVDVDGVVADLLTEWLRRYNEDYEDCLTVDDITAWDLRPFVKPECGGRIYEYLHVPDLYDGVMPIDGALEGVRRLRDAGHRIVFLTSCVGPEMTHSKLHWLERHGFRDLAHLILPLIAPPKTTPDKSLIRGDVMIDDYHENLDGFTGHQILFHAPHNALHHGYTRARSWADVPWLLASAEAS